MSGYLQAGRPIEPGRPVRRLDQSHVLTQRVLTTRPRQYQSRFAQPTMRWISSDRAHSTAGDPRSALLRPLLVPSIAPLLERARPTEGIDKRGRLAEARDLVKESPFVRSLHNPIIQADDLPYHAHAAFNPGATRFHDKVALLVRVEDFRGRSYFATALSADGETDWRFDPTPALRGDPEHYPEDAWGIEDPRIVYLPELEQYAVTFTSYSMAGPLVSLALTRDLISFERQGPICPPDDKDAAFFPRRFGGQWLLLHRPSPRDSASNIVLSRSADLRHWSEPELVLPAREGGWWDAGKVGMGPPPLETAAGWLLLYHGVRQTASGSLYRSGLALLDLDDPTKVIARTDDWYLGPEADYERTGDVPNVVFPSGWVLDPSGQQVFVYYGAADTTIGLATASLSDLLSLLDGHHRS
jgi:predicted GH43/DUF377 family glycosyl hydrolase